MLALPKDVQSVIANFLTKRVTMEVEGKVLHLGLAYTHMHYYLIFAK